MHSYFFIRESNKFRRLLLENSQQLYNGLSPSYPSMTHPSTSGTPYSDSQQCGVFMKLRTLLYKNFARSLSLTPIMMNRKYTLIQLSLFSKPCMRTPWGPFTATSRTTTAPRWVIVWDYHHNRGVMLWIPLHLLLSLPFLSLHASHASFVSSINYFLLLSFIPCFSLSYLWLTCLMPFISDSLIASHDSLPYCWLTLISDLFYI